MGDEEEREEAMNEQDFAGGVSFECDGCKNFEDAGEFWMVCKKCWKAKNAQIVELQVAYGKLMTDYQDLRDRARNAGIAITSRPSDEPVIEEAGL